MVEGSRPLKSGKKFFDVVRAGSRHINQTFNTTTPWSSLASPTAGAAPIDNAETDTTDLAPELVLKQTNTKRSTSISPMKNQDNCSIHTGSSQKSHPSTPAPARVGKSTLELVEFTDDLGVVHRIGFDPSGLVNLSHLADVVCQKAEDYLTIPDVAVLRHYLREAKGDDALIIIPRPATRSKRGKCLPLSARPITKEWWVHPAIAAHFLEYVEAHVLHAWFQWQRAVRGWARPTGWTSEFGFSPSEEEIEVEELRAALRECQRKIEVAAKPRPFTLKALPAAKTQLEKLTGMSPGLNPGVMGVRSIADVDREAAELLAGLDNAGEEMFQPGSIPRDLRAGNPPPKHGSF